VKNEDKTNSLTILDHKLRADFGKNTGLIDLNSDKMYEENDNGQFVNMFIKEYETSVSSEKKRELLFLE
jgi:hypothetical protein